MAITSYSELKTEVANWINREDLTNRIPSFIQFAENRINRRLRIRPMETAYSQATTGGTDTYTLPTRFAGFRSLRLNGSPKTDLDYVTPEIMDRVWAGSTSGQPCVYTLEGESLKLGPTPDGVYTVGGMYYAKFAPLSDSNTTNWLITDAPDLLIYAACLEAAPYMKDHPDIQVWDGFYTKAIQDIEVENETDRYSGGALQMRPEITG